MQRECDALQMEVEKRKVDESHGLRLVAEMERRMQLQGEVLNLLALLVQKYNTVAATGLGA